MKNLKPRLRRKNFGPISLSAVTFLIVAAFFACRPAWAEEEGGFGPDTYSPAITGDFNAGYSADYASANIVPGTDNYNNISGIGDYGAVNPGNISGIPTADAYAQNAMLFDAGGASAPLPTDFAGAANNIEIIGQTTNPATFAQVEPTSNVEILRQQMGALDLTQVAMTGDTGIAGQTEGQDFFALIKQEHFVLPAEATKVNPGPNVSPATEASGGFWSSIGDALSSVGKLVYDPEGGSLVINAVTRGAANAIFSFEGTREDDRLAEELRSATGHKDNSGGMAHDPSDKEAAGIGLQLEKVEIVKRLTTPEVEPQPAKAAGTEKLITEDLIIVEPNLPTWDSMIKIEQARASQETKERLTTDLVRGYVRENKTDAIEFVKEKFKDTDLVILGEEHQTRRHDSFTVEVLRSLKEETGVKYLALELNPEDQRLIDKFMESGNPADFFSEIPREPSTEDVLNVLKAARESKIKVVCVDLPKEELYKQLPQYAPGRLTGTPRDLYIAQQIIKIKESDPEAKILMQYGAFHADKAPRDDVLWLGDTVAVDRTPVEWGGPADKNNNRAYYSVASLLAHFSEKKSLKPAAIKLETFIEGPDDWSLYRYLENDDIGKSATAVPIKPDIAIPVGRPELSAEALSADVLRNSHFPKKIKIDDDGIPRATKYLSNSMYDAVILFPGGRKLYDDNVKAKL